ncbi:2Fe-2S iron-sulfur cluster binding domain-containing protein [Glaciimonas sp. GNP009]
MTDLAASAHMFSVMLVNTGQTVTCKAGETLLAAFMRSGKKGIPVGCRGGGCGVCKIEVISGQIHTKPMSRSHVREEDERARRLLACSVYPLSDLKVSAIGRLAGLIAPSQASESSLLHPTFKRAMS